MGVKTFSLYLGFGLAANPDSKADLYSSRAAFISSELNVEKFKKKPNALRQSESFRILFDFEKFIIGIHVSVGIIRFYHVAFGTDPFRHKKRHSILLMSDRR